MDHDSSPQNLADPKRTTAMVSDHLERAEGLLHMLDCQLLCWDCFGCASRYVFRLHEPLRWHDPSTSCGNMEPFSQIENE